jgi:hypothetical protein
VSKVPADTGCQQSNGNSTHELQKVCGHNTRWHGRRRHYGCC